MPKYLRIVKIDTLAYLFLSMDSPFPCTICHTTGHITSKCPDLYSPEKVSGGGGGGHSHDDDESLGLKIFTLY